LSKVVSDEGGAMRDWMVVRPSQYAEGTPVRKMQRYFMRAETEDDAKTILEDRYPEEVVKVVGEWPEDVSPHLVLTYDGGAHDRYGAGSSKNTTMRCSDCEADGDEWSPLAVDILEDGRIQVWCERHEQNVSLMTMSMGLPPQEQWTPATSLVRGVH
jgi:hypothetical protein